MRTRLVPALLAVLAALVLGAATPTAATPVLAGWSISPGGSFFGTGGSVDAPITCTGTDISGTFATGGTTLGVISRISYRNCRSSSALTLSISPRLSWYMYGLSHVNGVTTLEIRNVAANITGPGCNLAVAGKVTATYSNATGILTVLDHDTVVSPGSSCLGLVAPGDTIALLSRSYTISPRHIITPVP
jgi:hypothetical protein